MIYFVWLKVMYFTWGTKGGGSFLACNDNRLTFAISLVAFIADNDEIRFSGRTHNKDFRNIVNSGDHLDE